jgi:hypothetical protein
MAKRVADLVVDVLSEAGVQRMYGMGGDSLNGINDAIRTRPQVTRSERTVPCWPSSCKPNVRERTCRELAINLGPLVSPVREGENE